MSEVGYKKPPKHTQFKKGQAANPGGKTKEQKRIEIRNAEMAMAIRERVLHAALAKLNELSTDEVLEGYVDAAMLKLLKDAEDRGLGNPVQPHSGPNGESLVSRIVIEAAHDDRDNQTPS